MNKLKEKILKNTTIEFTSTLLESKIYTHKDMIPTDVFMINAALSGSVDGGLTPGLTMIAGESRNFKTGFSLLLASAFLQKYPEGIILFYDSEFGTTPAYFNTFKLDMNSVIHVPITDIEVLKSDLLQQLNNFNRDDHVMIIVDSIGNLASKKEIEDTLSQKSVADMTRAKQLKSLFRMVTPYLTLKDIPMVAINHTYREIGMYPKDIIGGGTGSFYSSSNIWIVGRQQEKDKDKEITGYNFIINVEKSRYVKEKSRIPITITHEEGINKWSGLFDIALQGGYILNPKQGWYRLTASEDISNFRQKDVISSDEFWKRMFKETDIKQYIEKKFKLG